MASTFSTDLALELVATGEKAGLWGSITNTNLQILQQSTTGVVDVAMTASSDKTLLLSDGATSDGKNLYLKLTGTMTGNVNLIIPASPTMGDEVSIMDVSASGGFGTNKVILDRNGSNIRGAASNLDLASNNQSIKLRFTNSTKGWQYVYNQTT